MLNLFKIGIVLTTAVSFSATTGQTHSVNNLEKTVDKELRKVHYMSCKAEKRKKCHVESFNKSIVLKIK